MEHKIINTNKILKHSLQVPICSSGPKILSKRYFFLFWNVMSMWNTNNHKKTRNVKWKSYNPKQESQEHTTDEFSWNLAYKVMLWISHQAFKMENFKSSWISYTCMNSNFTFFHF
jgi:hypothetical protein